MNKKHDDVIETLKSAHICLNQFLSFGTGVLGIEGMAARCATLMSADPSLEPSIPRPLAEVTPWLITGVDEIYENLKKLLDDRDLLRAYAEAGYKYALQNYSYVPATKRLVLKLRDFGFFSNLSHEMDPICVD